MDIAKFIQNLQNKPEPTKKLILWLSTGVIMLIIGSGWVVSFQAGSTVSMGPAQSQQQQNNNFGNIFKSFKKDMASLKEIIPSNATKRNIKEKAEQKRQKDKSTAEKTDETKANPVQKNKTNIEKNLYKLPLSNQK